MKTTRFSAFAALLLFSGMGLPDSVRAAPHTLRYEWSPDLIQPFAPVPASMIQVHPDGTATVATGTPKAYFQLRIEDQEEGKNGGTVPVLPLSAVPPLVLEMAREWIVAMGQENSEEGRRWRGARPAPFVTPLTSAWNDSGIPDMAEIRILTNRPVPAAGDLFAGPEGGDDPAEAGYMLVALNRKNPPLISYSTSGPTPAGELLAKCRGAAVHCLRRFGPMCLVAEDPQKGVIAQDGLIPVVFPDLTYAAQAQPLDYQWDSENPANPRFPEAPPRTAGVQDYPTFLALLQGYQNSAFLASRREQREALIEFDWLSLEGRAPQLLVPLGERVRFFETESFAGFKLEDEDGERPAAIAVDPAGGLNITGQAAGAWRLTLYPEREEPRRYLLTIAAPAGARRPRNGNEGPWVTTTQMWETGPEPDQPRFSQRSDLERWCDAVGCGPVMLALMQTWAEHRQNVPSAFWERTANVPLADRRFSLRSEDSPLTYITGTDYLRMKDWYDYWHERCNVACWPHNGSGSTLPWDASSALKNYVEYAASALMPLQVAADVGGPLLGGNYRTVIDAWGDDWDEAGAAVATGIKAGRPGGVYYMEHWHYAMAWRYRKTVRKLVVGGQVIKSWTFRSFRVNTGWGNTEAKKDRVWNAYDIDGCYLMNLWQKRQLTD